MLSCGPAEWVLRGIFRLVLFQGRIDLGPARSNVFNYAGQGRGEWLRDRRNDLVDLAVGRPVARHQPRPPRRRGTHSSKPCAAGSSVDLEFGRRKGLVDPGAVDVIGRVDFTRCLRVGADDARHGEGVFVAHHVDGGVSLAEQAVVFLPRVAGGAGVRVDHRRYRRAVALRGSLRCFCRQRREAQRAGRELGRSGVAGRDLAEGQRLGNVNAERNVRRFLERQRLLALLFFLQLVRLRWTRPGGRRRPPDCAACSAGRRAAPLA